MFFFRKSYSSLYPIKKKCTDNNQKIIRTRSGLSVMRCIVFRVKLSRYCFSCCCFCCFVSDWLALPDTKNNTTRKGPDVDLFFLLNFVAFAVILFPKVEQASSRADTKKKECAAILPPKISHPKSDLRFPSPRHHFIVTACVSESVVALCVSCSLIHCLFCGKTALACERPQ